MLGSDPTLFTIKKVLAEVGLLTICSNLSTAGMCFLANTFF